MTYAHGADLQTAVFQRLVADTTLTLLVGDEISDAPPQVASDDWPPLHVTLGDERVRDFDTKTSSGTAHDFSVTVHSSDAGYLTAKAVAAAVCDALIDAPLALSAGTLVALRFLSARADRGRPPARRTIALRFRAVIETTA